MDKQIKLLNKEYLATRIGELKEIKRGEATFKIRNSDRVFSKSIYIEFWLPMSGTDKFYKGATLRISDHEQENCMFEQIIINPEKPLTKKKKAELVRNLDATIKKAQIKRVRHALKIVENLNEKDTSD